MFKLIFSGFILLCSFFVFRDSDFKLFAVDLMLDRGFSSEFSLFMLGIPGGCGFISDLYFYSGPELSDAKTLSLTKSLLKGGCNIDDFSHHNGRTALSHASAQGDLDSVVFLLRLGANPALKDVNGYYPVDYISCDSDFDVDSGKRVFLELSKYGAKYYLDDCIGKIK